MNDKWYADTFGGGYSKALADVEKVIAELRSKLKGER